MPRQAPKRPRFKGSRPSATIRKPSGSRRGGGTWWTAYVSGGRRRGGRGIESIPD
jgi:hypothetical protein